MTLIIISCMIIMIFYLVIEMTIFFPKNIYNEIIIAIPRVILLFFFIIITVKNYSIYESSAPGTFLRFPFAIGLTSSVFNFIFIIFHLCFYLSGEPFLKNTLIHFRKKQKQSKPRQLKQNKIKSKYYNSSKLFN